MDGDAGAQESASESGGQTERETRRDEQYRFRAQRPAEQEQQAQQRDGFGPDMDEIIFGSVKTCRRMEIWTESARANIRYLYVRQRAIAQRNTVDPTYSDRILHKSQGECFVICKLVSQFLSRAVDAANAVDPKSGRVREWFTGVRAEATYKNIHYAEATIARLYNPHEVKSEALDAVRRARSVLAVDDLARHATLIRLSKADPKPCTADELSEIIAVGHEAADRNRFKLRSFRNVLLGGRACRGSASATDSVDLTALGGGGVLVADPLGLG